MKGANFMLASMDASQVGRSPINPDPTPAIPGGRAVIGSLESDFDDRVATFDQPQGGHQTRREQAHHVHGRGIADGEQDDPRIGAEARAKPRSRIGKRRTPDIDSIQRASDGDK